MNYSNWHIPISNGDITLRMAQKSLREIGAEPEEVPLMVRLVENPNLSIPGFTLFHGAVDLDAHDFIHILLGRGLLAEDEAFVIGYTMGATNLVTEIEVRLFELLTKYCYPENYQFKDRDLKIFRDGIRIALVAKGTRLDQVDFKPLLDTPLCDVRNQLGINTDLLSAYYRLEKQRNTKSKASNRLLDTV
jgi:hypothetical protein